MAVESYSWAEISSCKENVSNVMSPLATLQYCIHVRYDYTLVLQYINIVLSVNMFDNMALTISAK